MDLGNLLTARTMYDVIVQGTMLGGLYALYAAGLSLIFGVMRLVNLAHGDLIILSAFLIGVLSWPASSGGLGMNLFVATALVVVVMFVLGYALQSVILNRSLGKDILPPLLMTFGLSIIVQNGLLEAFSADSQRLRIGAFETATLNFGGGYVIAWIDLIRLAVAVGLIVALNQLFFRTALGRGFRAVSDDSKTAQLMGIHNQRIYAIAMGVALAIAAVAALFLGIKATFDPAAGPARLIFAFEAVIIGGLGSMWGTLAGGVILGVAQTLGAALDPGWQVLGGHVAFIIILLVRPRGLFPRTAD